VYALARSGNVAAANEELERLKALPKPHPLTSLLKGFVQRAKPSVGAPDTSAGRPSGDRGRLPTDVRQLVSLGETARAKGDNDRAQRYFLAAVERSPNDTEALHGLAALAHARHDLNGARTSYKRVLSVNPGYIPALVGAADVDWESGDRTSAMKTYKEIVERFPEGAYPSRVKQRVGLASSSAGAVHTPPPNTAAPAASPTGVAVPEPSAVAPAPSSTTPAPSDTGGGG
jgi:tetratricopeptide (TPR) repeat protein